MENQEVIAVALSTDENYGKYLSVTLLSLIENASKNRVYHLHVFDCGLKERTKLLLRQQVENLDGFVLYFHDVTAYLDKYKSIFYTRAYFTPSTYIRFFMADILQQYEKFIYIDCDLIVLGDVSTLYQADLGDLPLGAVTDQGMAYHIIHTPTDRQYFYDVLQLNDKHRYFNAGVLLINTKYWREHHVAQQCIDTMERFEKLLYQDQCVLNVIFKNQVFYLDTAWNVTRDGDTSSLPLNPHIIHYTGELKPWNTPASDLSDFWWQYARKSSFYEIILYDNIKILTRKMIKERSLAGKLHRLYQKLKKAKP